MFVRIKKIRHPYGQYQYVQVVKSVRDGKRVYQRVLGTLGELSELTRDGELESLISKLAALTSQAAVVGQYETGQIAAQWALDWGPVLVFRRLWQAHGFDQIIRGLSRRHGYGFDLNEMCFTLALQRLLDPGSDRRGSRWISEVYAPEIWKLKLHQFYRALDFLHKHQEEIEESLFLQGRDIFSGDLDLVLFDTTSTYYEGEGKEAPDLLKFGKSKDHRPGNLQVVVGFVLTGEGFPISMHVWPGNTSDMTTIPQVIEKLKKRFQIGRVVFVCDRGMVSAKNLKALKDAELEYIVGMKLSGNVQVRDKVLARPGRYRKVEENLHVKEVRVGENRYVVCFNPQEAERDRQQREDLIKKLKETLGRGPKGVVSNPAFKKFVDIEKDAIQIDEQRIREEDRYDGKYVLQTSVDWPAEEVAKKYKTLWMVEYFNRQSKSLIEMRALHHRKERRIRAHLFGAFLAMYLAVSLTKRLQKADIQREWQDAIRDLKMVRAIRLKLRERAFVLRTDMVGDAGKILQAVGVRPPPTLQPYPPGQLERPPVVPTEVEP
jgi:transposase